MKGRHLFHDRARKFCSWFDLRAPAYFDPTWAGCYLRCGLPNRSHGRVLVMDDGRIGDS
jgi:hypothetical protein